MSTIIQDLNNPNITYSIPTADELADSAVAQATIDAANALAEQKASIQAQLTALDDKSIRALRSINVAIQGNVSPNATDISNLQSHETQAIILRAQLADLS